MRLFPASRAVLSFACLFGLAMALPGPAGAQQGAAESPPPAVQYDVSVLPMPVRSLREALLAAARTGEVEALRPIIAANPAEPVFTFGLPGDPIETLKDQAGDEGGREILAILIEVLEAGFVHVDPGTPEEMYVWPYFFHLPIEALTGPQLVELFELVTAGDYAQMREVGAYLFYRVGIGPDGSWHFFVAGD